MSTLMRKRTMARDYSARKRSKPAPLPLYRTTKPEMKFGNVDIAHTTTTASDLIINPVAQGVDNNERVGNKIKIWRIEWFIRSSEPVRVDLVMPNDASVTATHTIDQPVDRDKFIQLKSQSYNPGVAANQLYFDSLSLPYGIISKYEGALGSSINKNKISVRMFTPSSTSVGGYFRIWYTDA